MTHYRFTRRAQSDLKAIVRYTQKTWGKKQALSYIEGLEAIAHNLAQNPKLGKTHDDLAKGIRGFGYQSHTLYYIEDKEGIVIVHVLHKKMDVYSHIHSDILIDDE